MATAHRPNTQPARLPENLRPLFWSYRFDELEAAKDEKTIIVQLINYGTIAQWHWLGRQYGPDEVKRVLEAIPATEIKPRTRVLASILFFNPTWRHAQRGAHSTTPSRTVEREANPKQFHGKGVWAINS